MSKIKNKIIVLLVQNFPISPFSEKEKELFSKLEKYSLCRIIPDEDGIFSTTDHFGYGTALLQLLPPDHVAQSTISNLSVDRILPTKLNRSSIGQIICYLIDNKLFSNNLPFIEEIKYPNGYFYVKNNKLLVCNNNQSFELPDFIQEYIQSLN